MRLLQEYEKKRDFRKTPEPKATVRTAKKHPLIFVVQEHHASHLHYDFRLEMEGVLKSWAVPKGPALDPSVKRLAVEVEDHPLSYAKFEGEIPAHEYGGGKVLIWDSGTWEIEGNPVEAYRNGKILFVLKGKKLKGRWLLVRTRPSENKTKAQWILRKLGKKKEKASTDQRRGSTLLNFIEPELALLVKAPPTGKGWIHETKYDGYRTQAQVLGGKVQLFTRTAQDWSQKYPTVVRALANAKVDSAILDGEVVWVDEKGRSDFQQLQNALQQKESTSILYYVFDLLYLNGEDLRALPLTERKSRLEKILNPLKGTAVLYSDHHVGEAEEFLETSCDTQLEGIVSKRMDSPYLSGRNDNWVKSKCKLRQEFVVGGFTEGQGARKGFGALLLGVYEQGKLRYIGRVGTGFNSDVLLSLRKRLSVLEQKKSPFAFNSPHQAGIHWVRPELVAEVHFADWTRDGILRVPVFQGLREDKPARQVKREEPAKTPQKASPTLPVITHPDKILFQKEQITKQDIADYLTLVSQWMLPHLSGRPLSLVRCPNGTDKDCFFQKHIKNEKPEHLKIVRIQEKTATREYMAVDSVEGLLELIQKGSLEFHSWNCRHLDTDHPDQMILDFDPGPGLEWPQIRDGVLEMKALLDELQLQSFAKVTGGKGIHIHIPLKPLYSWNQVKDFGETLALELTSRNPEMFTTILAKTARNQKIFIDYLRNSKSATAIAPYSLRAKSISSVALPVEWQELQKITAASAFTLKKALQKIKSRKQDPWKDYFACAQEIEVLNRRD